MKNIKPFILPVFVLVFLFLLYNFLYRDLSEPNIEFIPEMVYSVPYDAYSSNPHFPDGKTLRQPVKGTIARGYLPQYSDSKLTEENAGDHLFNPNKSGKSNLLRGEFVFRNFCQVCHGDTGKGDGTVIRKGVPPPPSLQTDKIKKMTDGQMYFIVSNGKGNMASYRSQVSREDIWKAILFIRTLK